MSENSSNSAFDPDQLHRPRPLKMSERIARHLVDVILGNGLEPGTRLPVESDLLKTLNVGRNTLREAMRLLEAWGVVEIRQGRNGGAIVRQPHPADLRGPLTVQMLFGGATLKEVLEVRLMLEPQTAYLAAKKMSESDADVLDDSVARMRSVVGHEAFIEENRSFHSAIAVHTGNIAFLSFIESIEAIFDGTAQGVVYSGKRRSAVADAHARIAKAIRDGDAEAARDEMRAHLEEAGEYWHRDKNVLEKKLNWPM